MKIAPVSPQGMSIGSIEAGSVQPAPKNDILRRLKMNTNATPGRMDEVPPPVAQNPEKLSNPDANTDQTQSATEEPKPISPQLAELARRRRALQVQERAIADREKALADKETANADMIPRAQLKSNPLGVLLDSGVTYEQLTEAVLANQNGYNPKIAALEAKIAELESGLDKRLTEKQTQDEQAALTEMRREATALVSQGETFELVRETGSIPTVMQLIERTYRKTGEVLDVREALTLVENELMNDSLKRAGLKKIQEKLGPRPPESQYETVPHPQAAQPQRQMRTLTNRDTASVPLSKRARALAAFNGTLKQ